METSLNRKFIIRAPPPPQMCNRLFCTAHSKKRAKKAGPKKSAKKAAKKSAKKVAKRQQKGGKNSFC